MEPLREVSAATSRVKVLDKEIAGAKRVLARLEAKKAKEIEAIEGFKADAIAEKERRDFSRSQLRTARARPPHCEEEFATREERFGVAAEALEGLTREAENEREERKGVGAPSHP